MPLLLIPLAPLLAFLILIVWGHRWGRASARVAILAMVISTLSACHVWGELLAGLTPSISATWFQLGGRVWTVGLAADPLAGVMLSVVTLIGTLIQIYSVGYMAGDARYSRFFAYLSLFCAAMLGLVLADNFLLLFICWELVGLCSYVLISFWFEKPAAAAAGTKAFLTTRVGDVGLLLAICALYAATGELQLNAQHHAAATLPAHLLTLITLGILAGAVGKSAQLPLHVWLPDAMEGPTAVSALIHAATMVAAGIYLVARTFPLFEAAEQTLYIAALIGTSTAFFAATIACVMTDIKRVLAYSTISQLGFMLAAIGVGSTTAGIFHLTTHAWFKALLFLGAGSVMHAVHTQDLREMGGLRHAMPITFWTMVIGVWAISGLPPLSGFWSKEAILVVAWPEHPVIALTLVLTSALTAFYMARWFALVFLGNPRRERQPRESPRTMTMPLIALAVGAAGVGLLGSPLTHHWFQAWLSHGYAAASLHGPDDAPAWLGPLTIVLAATAVGLGVRRYTALTPKYPPVVWRRWQPIYTVLTHQYYIDECYHHVIVQPLTRMARALAQCDVRIIDRAVDLAGLAGLGLSRWKAWCDRRLVDGLVNGLAAMAAWCGRLGRQLHTGCVQQYLLMAMVGTITMVWYALREGWR